MYMAIIGGYDVVWAFHSDKGTAKRLAVKRKKELCRNDLDKWSWERCKNWYGANVYEIKDGLVIDDYSVDSIE